MQKLRYTDSKSEIMSSQKGSKCSACEEVSLRFKYHHKGQKLSSWWPEGDKNAQIRISLLGRQSTWQSLHHLLKLSVHIKFLQFEELSLLECQCQNHIKPGGTQIFLKCQSS